jgi:D-glycero-beta-D-manno-heptose 1-phosphate adenylyltransferase
MVKTAAAARINSKKEKRYFANAESLDKCVTKIRQKKGKIVLTQGVFDLIHEGHAKYLEIAKSYGDYLIGGLDSDKLTQKRKGPGRPVVPQKERVAMLLHLRHVDYVVLRNVNEDIGHLIRSIKPDVLVTSHSTKDFTAHMAREYGPYCGKIITLEPQSTTSSSARIRKLAIEGASSLADEINKLATQFIEKLHQS